MAKAVRTLAWKRGLASAIALLFVFVGLLAAPQAAYASDGPTGFWYGTDSGIYDDASTPPGASPYTNPFGLGGHYGGYIGEIGGWWTIIGSGTNKWNALSAAYAEDNHRLGYGIGTTGYWMLGGPNMNPSVNAYDWGFEQGTRAVTEWRNSGSNLPLIWMDVESGQGWLSSASAHTNRIDFNGFFDAVQGAGFMVGVYSAPIFWHDTFGTGSDSLIPHTYEWTYESEYSIVAKSNGTTGPYSWCRRGSTTKCAEFFGGQTSSSPCALIWQWTSTAPGVNSPGDVDQIDANRLGSSGCV